MVPKIQNLFVQLIILHKKLCYSAKPGALGHSAGGFHCQLLSKNMFRKVSVVHNSCFQLQVSHVIVKLISIAIICKIN